MKIAWDREECSFMLVAWVARAFVPFSMQAISSSLLATGTSRCPSSTMLLPPRSLGPKRRARHVNNAEGGE